MLIIASKKQNSSGVVNDNSKWIFGAEALQLFCRRVFLAPYKPERKAKLVVEDTVNKYTGFSFFLFFFKLSKVVLTNGYLVVIQCW